MVKSKLSFFMFLQYFVWGSWYASMSTYLDGTLKFGGQQIGAAYGAFAIGAIVAPFFVGLIADRYFAAEKLLAFLSFVGALVMFCLPQFTTFATLYPALIVYCSIFAPTVALGNALSLRHLPDPKKDFPRVKVFSAIGWIGGGFALSAIHGEQSSSQFYLAGFASLVLAAFSLFLPHSPPRSLVSGGKVSIKEILGLDALALLKRRSFAIFLGCMFLICIPLYFYFVMMSVYLTEMEWTNVAAKLTGAQFSDIVFLFLLPVFLKKFGYKKTLALGIVAWVVRYLLLAGSVDAEGLSVVLIGFAIISHGVCYDFLFVAGQLYADTEADERHRSATQGLMAFVLWGIGAFVGTMLAGAWMAKNTLAEPVGAIAHRWEAIWLGPAILSAMVFLIFMIFFREPKHHSSIQDPR